MSTYKGVRYSAPHDTGGLLSERPKSASKAHLSEYALASLVRKGLVAMMAPANHRTIFAQYVKAGVVEGTQADVVLRTKTVVADGESNRRLPDRASFAADNFQRGESVVHVAGRTRGVVMGPSRSKPGFLKVSIGGEIFRVSPKNLKRL